MLAIASNGVSLAVLESWLGIAAGRVSRTPALFFPIQWTQVSEEKPRFNALL